MTTDESQLVATALRAGMARLNRRLRAERLGHGLSLNRLSLLGLLCRNGPMTATSLAAAERLQPQSLTRMLARLERDELIVRRPDDTDRRQVLIDVTEKGIGVLGEDTRRREAWLAGVMAERLTATERELLRLAAGLMDRLADG
jgi:DNA-binding MarR family transcriptional regulator